MLCFVLILHINFRDYSSIRLPFLTVHHFFVVIIITIIMAYVRLHGYFNGSQEHWTTLILINETRIVDFTYIFVHKLSRSVYVSVCVYLWLGHETDQFKNEFTLIVWLSLKLWTKARAYECVVYIIYMKHRLHYDPHSIRWAFKH